MTNSLTTRVRRVNLRSRVKGVTHPILYITSLFLFQDLGCLAVCQV